MNKNSDLVRIKTLDGEILETTMRSLKRHRRSSRRRAPSAKSVKAICPECGEEFRVPYYTLKINDTVTCPKCGRGIKTKNVKIRRKKK